MGGEFFGGYSSPDSAAALTVESYDFKNNKWKQQTKSLRFGKVFQEREAVIKAFTMTIFKEALGKRKRFL